MKKIIAVVLLMGAALDDVCAELFTFDLVNKNGASWDGASSGVCTNAGSGLTLEAAMFAYLNGSYSFGSQLNSTATEFGMNAAGAGDATSLFDTVNGQEALWVSFNRAVTVKSIAVSSFTGGNVETGAYQVASGSLVNFTASGTYTIDAALNQGSYFKVIAMNTGGGNGWILNSFTVEAVPEPATASLAALGGLMAWVVRRASRK
ncbi:MAG: hypothetical protein HOO88_03380 [Kiritimatiellaceae bacterium]|nr:hypothetical protein [Kiritimatiellaceae bacterium]